MFAMVTKLSKSGQLGNDPWVAGFTSAKFMPDVVESSNLYTILIQYAWMLHFSQSWRRLWKALSKESVEPVGNADMAEVPWKIVEAIDVRNVWIWKILKHGSAGLLRTQPLSANFWTSCSTKLEKKRWTRVVCCINVISKARWAISPFGCGHTAGCGLRGYLFHARTSVIKHKAAGMREFL